MWSYDVASVKMGYLTLSTANLEKPKFRLTPEVFVGSYFYSEKNHFNKPKTLLNVLRESAPPSSITVTLTFRCNYACIPQILHAHSSLAMAGISKSPSAAMSTSNTAADLVDKSQKARPEKPDEQLYKDNLGKAEKELAVVQDKVVRPEPVLVEVPRETHSWHVPSIIVVH